MTETIPAMKLRHKREVSAALERLAAERITQTEAARRDGMRLTDLNGMLVRAGIYWPAKRQGRPRAAS